MLSSFVFLGLFWTASAVTMHSVQVGDINGTTQFFPDAISAVPGDIVQFHFAQKNHSVVQSSFADPCAETPGGFNSGFMPVPAGQTTDLPTFNITVSDDKPIWVYCGQKNPVSHCGLGMVFAVNCGPDGSTTSFSAFKAAAIAEGSAGSSSSYSSPPASTPPPPTSDSTPSTQTDASSAPSTGSVESGNIIKVTVGGNGTLTYNPPFVTAQIGDTVQFEFQSKNHTATQSSFADPCTKLVNATTGQTGFDSDFQPVAAGTSDFPTFNVSVTNTAPMWVYCKQKNPISHCAAGMVFAINANESSSKSYEAFLTLAKQTNTSSPASASPSLSGNSSSPTNGSSPANPANDASTFKVINWLGLLAVAALTILAH